MSIYSTLPVLFFLAAGILVGVRNDRRERAMGTPPRLWLPFLDSLQRALNGLRCRRALPQEFTLELREGGEGAPDDLIVAFPVPRRVHTVELRLPAGSKPAGPRVRLAWQGEEREVPAGCRPLPVKAGLVRLAVELTGSPCERLTLRLGRQKLAGEMQVFLRLVADRRLDLRLLKRIFRTRKITVGEVRDVAARYEDRHSRANPHVTAVRARIHDQLGETAAALSYAFRTMALGHRDVGVADYRTIAEKVEPLPREDLAVLLAADEQWQRPEEQGARTLLDEQEIWLEAPGAPTLRRRRVVLCVRRRAAARKLRQLAFTMRADHEMLLHSALWVHRAGGEVERMPLVHFSLSDLDQQGLAGQRRLQGSWLLPDLNVGDALEYRYDLWVAGGGPGPGSLFVLATVGEAFTQTLEGSVAFVAPAGLRLKFAHGGAEFEREEAETRLAGRSAVSRTFRLRRQLSRCRTSAAGDLLRLEARVACGEEGATWEEVERRERTDLLGGERLQDELPPALQQLVAGDDDVGLRLARLFYWLRAHFRYARLETPSQAPGADGEGRAARLLARGLGDCKHFTHLLAVACDHLRIPWDLLLVSTAHRTLVPEVPGRQFDHVLVRAQVGGQVLYLDASDQMNPFGDVPPALQGIDAMILDGRGTLIRVPDDELERNVMHVIERLEAAPDGSLVSTAEVRLCGALARHVAEWWKRLSLEGADRLSAAQQAASWILPGLRVEEESLLEDATESDVCAFSCRGRRARPVPLEGRLLTEVAWRVPSWRPGDWQQTDVLGLFGFYTPQRLLVELTFALPADRPVTVSTCPEVEDELCLVRERVEREAGELRVQRVLEIRRRLLEGEEVTRLAGMGEALESGLKLVVELGGAVGAEAGGEAAAPAAAEAAARAGAVSDPAVASSPARSGPSSSRDGPGAG